MKTLSKNVERVAALKHPVCQSVGYVVVLTVLVLAQAGAVHALTRYVSNYGGDSGVCNPASHPCRSISYAISQAVANDTILVGPGIYDAAHEVPSGTCMITVDKQLKIKSRNGAGATTLNAGGSGLDVVCITAAGAGTVFGALSHGFTLSFGNNGLIVQSGASAVVVQGNFAFIDAANGFETFADHTKFVNNVAMNADLSGFADFGTNTTLKSNLARFNQTGLQLAGSTATATKNVLTLNSTNGAEIDLQPGIGFGVFNHNSMVSNQLAGLNVKMAGTFSGPVTVALDHNDYFANGNNCGIAGANTDTNSNTLTINSLHDFWGASTGPGADPADNVNGPCNSGSGSVTVSAAPFSTTELAVLPPSIR